MVKSVCKSLFLWTLIMFLGLGSWSQGPVFNGKDAKGEEVEFSMTFSKYPKDICVGDEVTLCFTGKVVAPGWHLYSSRTDGEISYKPTEFYIFEEDSEGAELSGNMTENKKPHEFEDELMGGVIRDFKEKEVTFCQKIKITKENVDIEAELAFQFCVDPDQGGMCKFLNLPFEWAFKAKSCGENLTPENNDTEPEIILNESKNGTHEKSAPRDNNSSVPSDTVTLADTNGFRGRETEMGAFNLSQSESIVLDYSPISGSVDTEGCTSGKIWSIFLIAFGAGLVSLFTPCVFPMIPLTVSYFVKQGGGDDGGIARRQGIRNGFTYSLSILLIYAVLGLVITVIFGPTALYDFASNPWANFAFFAIFFLFALSFFGLFDLTLPSSFSSKISTKAGTGGFIGIFLMALTLVIVSFSCTGPILGSLVVGVANSDCFWAPVAGFAGFGVAFGIPFGLLALFPNALKALPSSGGWLNSVKVVLGFLELALCMKFLSNADLIWHWNFLNREVFIGIWMVLFVLLGLYLLGKIRLPHDDKLEKVPVPRMILAIFSFSFVMYLFPGMHGSSLHLIEGFLPGFNENIGVKLLPGQVQPGKTINDKIGETSGRRYLDLLGDHEATGFNMFFDLKQAIYFARYYDYPILVDFTGHSCANCRNMENSVWISGKVRKLLKEEFVMVALFADEDARLDEVIILPGGKKLRRISDFVKHYQAEKFQVISQPYYAILNPWDLKEPLAKPVGYSSEEVFYEMLTTGIKNYQEQKK